MNLIDLPTSYDQVRGTTQFRVTYDLNGDMDLRQTGEVTTTQEKDQEIIIKKILIGFDESDIEKITRCGLTLAKSLGAETTAILL